MATNSFERKIVIRDKESQQALQNFLESSAPARKLDKPVFSDADRERSEELLARCLSRFNL